MNVAGSGFISLLIYGVFGGAPTNNHVLITDSTNLDILAEDGDQLLTET